MIGIYKITNKTNGRAYVGQSIHIEQRWQEHISQNKNSLIHLAIKKYGVKNFTFEVLEECQPEELDIKEQYWIKYYNTYEEGYNLTMGGKSGFKYDVEAVYQEFCKTQNLSQTAKNIGCHESTVRNIIRTYGINLSNLQENKIIEQIDPTTLQVIKRYASIQEAADAVKVHRSAITMAINGTHKSSAGYYWREMGSNKIFTPAKITNKKQRICQMTMDGKVVAIYNSSPDAAEALGKGRKTGHSNIIAVCNGKKKSAYGFLWKKID